MFQFQIITLLFLILTFSSSLAFADLPSLMTDAPGNAANRSTEPLDTLPPGLREFESLHRGKLRFNFGAVDYRLASGGLKATLTYRGTAITSSVGYAGDHRLELGWRSGGRSVKVALSADDSSSGYRIEFIRDF